MKTLSLGAAQNRYVSAAHFWDPGWSVYMTPNEQMCVSDLGEVGIFP